MRLRGQNIRAFRSRQVVGRWLGRGFWAVMDQGLFAVSNFILNVFLARWLPAEQYGAYAVAYSVFLLLGAFHTAILTEPMLVFGPGKYAEWFPRYLGLLLYAHAGLAIPVSVAIAGMALICRQFEAVALAQALAGLAVASPCILLLWLLRRAFYVSSQPQWAAAGGAFYLLMMLGGAYGLYWWHALSSTSALIIMGAAGFIVGLWLIFLLQPQWRCSGGNLTPRMVLADHWSYGKWSSASTILTWLPGNIYFILLPVWVGLEGSAALRAITNLVMPVLHTISAIAVILVPEFVKALNIGRMANFRRLVRSSLFLFAIASVGYWGFLIAFRRELLVWLYGARYTEYADVVILLGLSPLSAGVVAVLGSALRAMKLPDKIFWCYMISTSVALTLGLWLLATKDVVGAATGLLSSSITTAVTMAWFYIS